MKEQEDFETISIYAARLGEERKRVDPHQGDFSERLGITQGQQSLFERGKTQLRAPYLERIADEGLDILYILTGERCVNKLDGDATELVNMFLGLPADLRESVLLYVRSFAAAIHRLEGGRQEQKQIAKV